MHKFWRLRALDLLYVIDSIGASGQSRTGDLLITNSFQLFHSNKLGHFRGQIRLYFCDPVPQSAENPQKIPGKLRRFLEGDDRPISTILRP
jgi:hypothetical protein